MHDFTLGEMARIRSDEATREATQHGRLRPRPDPVAPPRSRFAQSRPTLVGPMPRRGSARA